ncbi:MAG: DUF1016 N-terminal domain-containing protein, partial [Paludibacteraceae bacterium]|nr:DUF1016 N-terminal domain-containing protein [Paludibacteraceae bacterium]
MNSNEIEKLTNLPVSADLATDVRTILQEARKIVARQTNTAMTAAYWLIGKRIVEEEQHGEDRAIYGDALLKNLSKELTAEFGNGFSYTNLKNMRKFYKTYQDKKGQTLSAQLSWSHNCLIMRVQDPKAREWYLREAAQEQWSVRQLERNINSFYYQRQLEKGLTSGADKCVANSEPNPRTFMKDPY